MAAVASRLDIVENMANALMGRLEEMMRFQTQQAAQLQDLLLHLEDQSR